MASAGLRGVFVLLLVLPGFVNAAGGGTTCAACTVLVGLFEQLAVVHSTEIIDVAKGYCDTLPDPTLQRACILFLDRYGERIIEGFVKNQTSDVICRRIELCTEPKCHLFPIPSKEVLAQLDPNERAPPPPQGWATAPEVCELPVVSEICKLIERFADEHLPLQDSDKDSFSTIPTFRGFHWRGKDCNDGVSDIYPGRRSSSYRPEVDHNCNGIAGVNQDGVSWEELLCANSDPRGLILLGDSATAHFSIPPNWLNATAINGDTYEQLIFIASNELDWPQQSGGSGILAEGNRDCPGPIDSLYLRLRERNRCNHRDYHNIGVNGARVGSMEKIVLSTNRNGTYDQPALVVYALIGNDVCNSSPGTERMTTPQDFKQRVVNAMLYLDTILPYNSHVLFVGLVDGRVLWDTMNAEIHPIGAVFNDVTYADFYNYLNCLEISPCASWMNNNQTYREAASQRAAELNEQYKIIIQENRFQRFDMFYMDYPIFEVIDYWVAQGGKAKDLIEAADGFHPSQLANAVGTKFFWDTLEKNRPDWLGPVNPFNAEIDRLFGDQGGH